MAGPALALFCSHKRLRTACIDCTPTLTPPTALDDDVDAVLVARRRRRA
jgi:hypothetical protein